MPTRIVRSGIQATRKRLLRFGTALLSDAMGKTGAMQHDMRCFSAHCRMAGPATTVRVHTADILMIGKALSVCPKGHVLVIDGQGELNTALWGGATTACARLKELAGVVIDGAVRDRSEIRRDRLPVFARAVVPNAGGAEYAGEINIPIQCGGCVVQPGDWVIGDEDGVVVVPANRLASVLTTASRLAEVEKRIYRQIRQGRDLATLLRYDELLARKSKGVFLPQMRFLEGGK
ncbi:MAG: RraA family protein [Verrucomicrobia bacterium]|nr:RraA family protein [Verrucomicrobiota bacterium]